MARLPVSDEVAANRAADLMQQIVDNVGADVGARHFAEALRVTAGHFFDGRNPDAALAHMHLAERVEIAAREFHKGA